VSPGCGTIAFTDEPPKAALKQTEQQKPKRFETMHRGLKCEAQRSS